MAEAAATRPFIGPPPAHTTAQAHIFRSPAEDFYRFFCGEFWSKRDISSFIGAFHFRLSPNDIALNNFINHNVSELMNRYSRLLYVYCAV